MPFVWLKLAGPQQRRDATVALVGFTSWMAVCWKLSRMDTPALGSTATEALLALGAAVLCLWPLVLGLASGSSYTRWREWLVPMHLALQHWIGLRFALPPEAQPLLATPGWARNMLPVFLATFCQPWLYLAFGACLQRTRLRTFLWTQPLLLAPVFWVGRAHCTNQLAASLEAARHLQHIASAMQRCASWLPVGPMLASVGAPATATSRRLSGSEGACLGVHFWLVVVLAYGLPAIVIHRLEGQEDHAWQLARKQRRQQEGQQRRQQEGQQGHEPGAADGDAAVERDLLLQRRPNAIGSAAELMLAGYAAWLLVQLTLPLLG